MASSTNSLVLVLTEVLHVLYNDCQYDHWPKGQGVGGLVVRSLLQLSER